MNLQETKPEFSFRLLPATMVALFALLLSACASNQGNDVNFAIEGTQSTWVTSRTDDGGLMVTWREGRAPANFDASYYNKTSVERAIEQASRLRPIDNATGALGDVHADIDTPGVVKLGGVVTSRREAIEVVNATLNVRGVRAVVSYLQYPNQVSNELINNN